MTAKDIKRFINGHYATHGLNRRRTRAKEIARYNKRAAKAEVHRFDAKMVRS